MKPTPREIVLAALNHEECGEIPYTIGFDDDVGPRLDAHYGTPAWRERIARYFNFVTPAETEYKEPIGNGRARDACGAVWRLDMRPWCLESPPLKSPSLDGYDFPEPEAFIRPGAKERAEKTIAEDGGRHFTCAFMGWGLFERSWSLRGFENILADFAEEPEFVGELLDKITDLYLRLVEYNVRNFKLDAVFFGDDWGDQRGVIMGPELWRKFIKPRQAKLYEACRRAGVRTVNHSCGAVAEIIPDLIEIGLDCLESCQPEAAGMNPFELKRKFGDRLAFWGCLGSQSIIPYGTPEQLAEHIARLRREMGKGGGFILAPAKGLMVETPTENAVAILEAFTGAAR